MRVTEKRHRLKVITGVNRSQAKETKWFFKLSKVKVCLSVLPHSQSYFFFWSNCCFKV